MIDTIINDCIEYLKMNGIPMKNIEKCFGKNRVKRILRDY